MKATINYSLVDSVCKELPEGKIKRLRAGLAILQASLDRGGWMPRGRATALAGTHQGLCKVRWAYKHLNRDAATPEQLRAHDIAYGVEWALQYGQLRTPPLMAEITIADIQETLDAHEALKIGRKPVSAELIFLWVRLLYCIAVAVEELDAARPVPVITPIGLSPRVTETLTACNLDLDLPSIRMADIEFYEKPVLDDHGVQKLTRLGEPMTMRVYFVKWSEGIAHDRSRFSWYKGGGQYLQCHACGKGIPSGMFVPIEAWDKKSKLLVSLWLGCDCARNIFGIKDIGIEQKAAP